MTRGFIGSAVFVIMMMITVISGFFCTNNKYISFGLLKVVMKPIHTSFISWTA